MNTINIVIELSVLDKSKNPSRYDFVKLDCYDKRKELDKNLNLLSLNLFGIDLHKKKDEDYKHKRFFFNRNVKEPEKKIQYPPFGYPPYGYPPYGYPIPPPPPLPLKPAADAAAPSDSAATAAKKGGRKTIKRKNGKVKKHGLKIKKIKRKTMKKNTLKKNTLKNKH